jgi:phospholipid/cholesterol/gamma-HCH transport system ATP-binding protein
MTPPLTPIVKFDGVSLGYGEFTVLSGIDLEVLPGQVVAMMGGSGSGKTTLLRAATGQLRARAGTVRVFGQDMGPLHGEPLLKIRQRMGVLFQGGALFTDLDVFENVAFPLREHTCISESQILERALATLNSVGLRHAAHLRISEISGGMARRVALARAVVLEPELILYDEPFAGLDPISLGITAQLIRTMTDHLHCASIVITHDVGKSLPIADQIYLIGQGRLIAHGTPAELSASKDDYLQQFLQGRPDGPIGFHYPLTPAFERWLAHRREAIGA